MDTLLNLVLNEFDIASFAIYINILIPLSVPFPFYTIVLSDIKMTKYFSDTKECFQDLLGNKIGCNV